MQPWRVGPEEGGADLERGGGLPLSIALERLAAEEIEHHHAPEVRTRALHVFEGIGCRGVGRDRWNRGAEERDALEAALDPRHDLDRIEAAHRAAHQQP